MRLDQILVSRALCESRAEAQELIRDSSVFVNGEVCTKQSKNIHEESDIIVTKRRKFVSRGGEKLHGALLHTYYTEEAIRNFCHDKTALDIGSSTGGFSDCLLSCGVRKIDAVDVGTNQLHHTLRNDHRISLYENTDIRKYITTEKYSLIVADLSFISLSSVFDVIVNLCESGTTIFLLIKPQFEVGKGNTKKGIVKNEELTTSILNQYKEFADSRGFTGIEIFKSSIQGGDGNQEYFLYGVKR